MIDDVVSSARARALDFAAAVVNGTLEPREGAGLLSQMRRDTDSLAELREQLTVFSELADAWGETRDDVEAQMQCERETVAAATALRRRYLAFPSRATATSTPDFGDGNFEFGRWETPFENANVEVMEIAWGFGPLWSDDDKTRWSERTLLRSPYEFMLVILVRVNESNAPEARYPDPLYRVAFKREVEAFRVLDEGGLSDFWHHTKVLGGRPAQTTFRVRNHEWFQESVLPWVLGTEDGWSFVIATDGDCIEIVARDPPEITLD